MKSMILFVSAALLAAPLLVIATPSEARTAFQQWAQGRGAYVNSSDRLDTWQDDLGAVGLLPPPAYRYRHTLPPRYLPDYDGQVDSY